MRKIVIIIAAVILAVVAMNTAWMMSVLSTPTIAAQQISDSGHTRTPGLW